MELLAVSADNTSRFAATARLAKMPGMSWEAYRWTAKSPSELYHTLGPHGVDHLVRQMLDACWRQSPEEGRSLAFSATLTLAP